jgi:hypothetical protein
VKRSLHPAYADTWATPEQMAARSAEVAPLYGMPVATADEIRAAQPHLIEMGLLERLPDGGIRVRFDRLRALEAT